MENNFIEKIVPFIHRKSLLLSISFRAVNLDIRQYKMKVESLHPIEQKEPLITGLCEATMVKKNK
jgi:hypothetical protein